jgi:DNA-binding transcriptional MerR regulator/effector-binding domain-containing protein
MFRIGEFAQIAQVSGRLLRYYDQLGLLCPVRIDPQTGYRWYSARQLPRLNRILALKELGLTLEQIKPLLDGEIPAADMRAMLAERRNRAADALRLEEARLRQIESRIAQIDEHGDVSGEDVVLKAIPAQSYLAASCICEDMDHAVRVVGQVVEGTAAKVSASFRDRLIVVSRTEQPDDRLDLDIGFSLTRDVSRTVKLAGGLELTSRELPAVETMATIVRSGPAWNSHFAFGAIGAWIEANAFELGGPCREVFLDQPGSSTEPIIEIQFPVRRAA